MVLSWTFTDLSSPSNVREFYPYAVNIIYAVIITLSFEIAAKVFIPLDTPFQSYDSFLRSSALVLSYFFIISGWIGYTKSIAKRPHRESQLGNARFVIDLVILFLAFYLLSLTEPERFESFVSVFNTFIWIFPISFMAYIIWDALKYFEYRTSSEERQTSISRWRVTGYAFALLLVQATVYSNLAISDYYERLTWDNQSISEFPFIITSTVIIFLYRRRKWPVPDTSFRKKALKRRPSTKPDN